jgi:hypothetical protein
MIETSLLVKIACDDCEMQVDMETPLGDSPRTDIPILEGRLASELEDEFWVFQEKNGERFVLCPYCAADEDQ